MCLSSHSKLTQKQTSNCGKDSASPTCVHLPAGWWWDTPILSSNPTRDCTCVHGWTGFVRRGLSVAHDGLEFILNDRLTSNPELMFQHAGIVGMNHHTISSGVCCCYCLVLKQNLTFWFNCPGTHDITQADCKLGLLLLFRLWDCREGHHACVLSLFVSLRQGLILKPRLAWNLEQSSCFSLSGA